jgi:hypothetical protein
LTIDGRTNRIPGTMVIDRQVAASGMAHQQVPVRHFDLLALAINEDAESAGEEILL